MPRLWPAFKKTFKVWVLIDESCLVAKKWGDPDKCENSARILSAPTLNLPHHRILLTVFDLFNGPRPGPVGKFNWTPDVT